MTGLVADAPLDATLLNRGRFFSAYRSAQETVAETGAPPGENRFIDDGHDDFRQPPRPYPGLRSFNPREGNVFFGRERNVRDIRERLSNNRVVVVLGGSGSGKSSVIRAGLMPRLTSTMGIRGRSGNWYAAEFRPRLHPMSELAEELAKLVQRKFPEQGAEIPVDPERVKGGIEYDTLRARIRASLQLGSEEKQRAKVSSRPDERTLRAEKLCDGLFDFVDRELDQRDREATQGLRSGRPSLLLVIDQFEEVFRPEVPMDEVGGRYDLLDTIIAACARIEDQPQTNPEEQSGLFIAITMRSEELHRCAEHPSLGLTKKGATKQHSLADLVNRSGYLLDLLDPEQDRQELTDAIVQPARRVFEDWGLPFDRSDEHAPFEPKVVEWLLVGAAQLSQELEHRADQLPLLQHALQTMWHRAIAEWEAASAGSAPLFICRHHLHGGGAERDNMSADLVGCLDIRANEARERAIERYTEAVQSANNAGEASGLTPRDAETTSVTGAALAAVKKPFQKLPSSVNVPPGTAPTDAAVQTREEYIAGGRAVIRAAFRSLARRDDRGNWARRFAELERVREFLSADPEVIRIPGNLLEQPVRSALGRFIAAGYLTGGDGRPYDISHEALIRNWQHCQYWLLDPEEAAQALIQAVNFLDVNKPADFVSPAIAKSLGLAIGDTATLPKSWAKEQIAPLLRRPNVREKWGKSNSYDPGGLQQLSDDVLDSIDRACKRAEQERIRQEENEARLQIFELEQESQERFYSDWHRTALLLVQQQSGVARHVAARARRLAVAFGIALLVTWIGLAVYFFRESLHS